MSFPRHRDTTVIKHIVESTISPGQHVSRVSIQQDQKHR